MNGFHIECYSNITNLLFPNSIVSNLSFKRERLKDMYYTRDYSRKNVRGAY